MENIIILPQDITNAICATCHDLQQNPDNAAFLDTKEKLIGAALHYLSSHVAYCNPIKK